MGGRNGLGGHSWAPLTRSIASAEPNTLSGKAYDLIRADVLGGRMAPGSKLTIDSIRHQYGIGSGPMREAMTRLAAEGLLTSEGQKGFRVAAATVAELVDVGRVRLELELRTISAAINGGGVDWKIGLMDEFYRLQQAQHCPSEDAGERFTRWEAAHRAFHLALAAGCSSPWLLYFRERIYDQTERYRRLFPSQDAAAPLISDHEDIFYAALRRDAKTCATLLARHIVVETRQTMMDMLARGAPPDPAADGALADLAGEWGVSPLRPGAGRPRSRKRVEPQTPPV